MCYDISASGRFQGPGYIDPYQTCRAFTTLSPLIYISISTLCSASDLELIQAPPQLLIGRVLLHRHESIVTHGVQCSPDSYKLVISNTSSTQRFVLPFTCMKFCARPTLDRKLRGSRAPIVTSRIFSRAWGISFSTIHALLTSYIGTRLCV